jgi:hypothetical protein
MSSCASNRSHRCSDDNWRFDFSVRRVTDVRGLLHDLSHGLEGEVEKDFVDDSPTARHCRPNRHSRGGKFADGSIPQALITELVP